jgi:hypothetical protein
MNIRIHQQLTADDYYQAQLIHYRFGPTLAFACFIATGILAIIVFAHETDPLVWLTLFAVWLAVVPTFYFFWRWSMYRRACRSFAQHKALQAPRDVEFSDDKINGNAGDRGVGTTPWSDIRKWRANEKILLLYATDSLFYLFPRSNFASGQDYAEVIAFARKTIGPAGKVTKRT